MNIKNLVISVVFLFCHFSLKAQDKPDNNNTYITRPVYANFQFAGNVGLVSIGIGTAVFQEKIYLGLVYGYLPESINDVEVHTPDFDNAPP